VRAFAHTFGILAPTADSASGGFVRQIPPLPVTPAIGQPYNGVVFSLCPANILKVSGCQSAEKSIQKEFIGGCSSTS
jgi:hypothetical protein